MAVHNCNVFMHNGAPCHRAKSVKSFLQENVVTTMVKKKKKLQNLPWVLEFQVKTWLLTYRSFYICTVLSIKLGR